MPSWSKLEFCKFAALWAGQECDCQNKLDFEGENVNGCDIEELVGEDTEKLTVEENRGSKVNVELKGVRIPLPWEFLQPVLRIVGHCLLGPLNSQDIKDAGSVAVGRLYVRASHDLVPQAIIGTRSLIQLHKRERAAAPAEANSSSNVNTPSKAKKPEILLVSK
ncbi:hypothetical protein Patl1_37010 [Pistacia atlantica]|nr:hypothetical protein Patl1_37010 [Pistacia atlantica]